MKKQTNISILTVGDTVQTQQWQWEIVSVNAQNGIARVLVWDNIVELKANYLMYTNRYQENYLNAIIDKYPDWRKIVSKYDWEPSAWNITGSTNREDNLELIWFFQWIQKVCFIIWISHTMKLPSFDSPNFKKEFADNATDIWEKNIESLLAMILFEYEKIFWGNNKYLDLPKELHIYQFIKMINSTLQHTQIAKAGLNKDILRLTDNELIQLVKKLHWWLPLIVSADGDIWRIVQNIIGYTNLTWSQRRLN